MIILITAIYSEVSIPVLGHFACLNTMPSAPLNFRTVCGQFVGVFVDFMLHRAKLQIAMKTATLKISTRVEGVTAGLLLSFLYLGQFLFLCGDVELNPGPPKGSSTKQTKLTSGGRTRRCSPDNTLPEPSPSTQSNSSGPTLRDVMDLITSMNESWSKACDTNEVTETNQSATETITRDEPTPEESTDSDLMAILSNLNSKFKDMQTNLLKLTNMCSKIQNEISRLKNEHEEIKKENSLLKERFTRNEKKMDTLEFQSKRNNCLFYGVLRKENETNLECEQAVRQLLTEKLDISEPVELDKIYRSNNKPDSPIVARFSFYRQKEAVIRARRKLQGTKIFVGDDFPFRIREIRRNLVPFLKEARAANKRAFMVYDHLIIEGKKFCLHQGRLQEQD